MYVVGACPGSRGVLNEQTLNNFNSAAAAASIIVPILYSAPFIAHYELKTSKIVQKMQNKSFDIQELISKEEKKTAAFRNSAGNFNLFAIFFMI
jgi:hypothetical protein